MNALKDHVSAKDLIELKTKVRATWAQIVGGAFVLIGLYLAWKRLEVAREGQITDRFTRAIELLRDSSLQSRLGAIYSLERIAWDSQRDHWPIMEVLTAYVREKRSLRGDHPLNEDGSISKPPPDVAAVLTVLRRRKWEREIGEDRQLDLMEADLRGAELREARFERVNLWKAQLQGANLWSAHLQGANLCEAHLEGTNLGKADLQGAFLQGAFLEEADLGGSQLQGADLTDAKGVTPEEIAGAKRDETTHMGYPLDSGSPNILWLGSRGLSVPVGDDRSIRRWVHGDCLLHKAVEEFSPAA